MVKEQATVSVPAKDPSRQKQPDDDKEPRDDKQTKRASAPGKDKSKSAVKEENEMVIVFVASARHAHKLLR